MVYVRLAQKWTDASGNHHRAGEMVDVDAATLAELESRGVVTAPDGAWPAPTGGGGGTDGAWPAPTGGGGGTDGAWPAPTDDDET